MKEIKKQIKEIKKTDTDKTITCQTQGWSLHLKNAEKNREKERERERDHKDTKII